MKKPTKRCDFLNDVDELNYLNDVVRYFHIAGQSEKAAACLRRMEALLTPLDLDDGGIMLQDHWAVLHEVRGNIVEAIVHREREVELLDYLLSLGPVPPMEPFLANAMRALANDYAQVGETEKEQQLRRRIEELEQNRAVETKATRTSDTTLASCSMGDLQSRSIIKGSPCRKSRRRPDTHRRGSSDS